MYGRQISNLISYIEYLEFTIIWDRLYTIQTMGLLVTIMLFIWWLRVKPCEMVEEPQEVSKDTPPVA